MVLEERHEGSLGRERVTALPGKDQETERSAVDLKVNGVRKEKERLTAHKQESLGLS